MIGGGAEVAVLDPLPASILPTDDQSRMSPPAIVNSRDCATSMLLLAKALMSPFLTVKIPVSYTHLTLPTKRIV